MSSGGRIARHFPGSRSFLSGATRALRLMLRHLGAGALVVCWRGADQTPGRSRFPVCYGHGAIPCVSRLTLDGISAALRRNVGTLVIQRPGVTSSAHACEL